jgi:Flp pilus assembly pilin Flp
MPLNHFLRDQRGAVMVEVTIMLSITLVLVLGAIYFLLLFYQWNAAAKAVQIGARAKSVARVTVGWSGLSKVGHENNLTACVFAADALPRRAR